MPEESKKVVLVVEDDAPLRHALELKLKHEGVEVVSASNGQEALDKINGGANYSLILLDLIMPDVDGFAVLEQLKTKGVQTPVLVLTNLGQNEDKTKVMSLGARGVFIKSDTSISDIVEETKKYLQ